MKSVASSDTNILIQQNQVTHTLPHQHHYQKQHQTHHATLPRKSMLPDISTQQNQVSVITYNKSTERTSYFRTHAYLLGIV